MKKVEKAVAHAPCLREQRWSAPAAVVDVYVPTFNHERFIRSCIESILDQRTTFPVKLTVYDDASTDRTPDILREYQAAYPKAVSVMLGEVNQYSKGKFFHYYNEVVGQSEAAYIARCGGDDLWQDPLKLQKQFDFLEAHTDYVISGHDCLVVDEAGLVTAASLIPKNDQRDAQAEELVKTILWISGTTVMHRNLVRKFPKELALSMHTDSWLFSLLGHHGKYHFHDDIAPACYRRHSGGIWSQRSKQVKQAEWCNSMYWLYRYYQRIDEAKYADYYLGMHSAGCLDLAEPKTLIKAALHRIKSHVILRLRSLRFWNPLTLRAAFRRIFRKKQ